MINQRSSGILLHITSLPSSYGIGDLGPGAFQFVDFLHSIGQKVWQILPLTPTDGFLGNSPYSSCSAFAGNSLLISPDSLIKERLLSKSEAVHSSSFPREKVNYKAVTKYKNELLVKCYKRNRDSIVKDHAFKDFCAQNAYWLDDYSLFKGIKAHKKEQPWFKWPDVLRNRKNQALENWREQCQEEIDRQKFIQFLFFRQWSVLQQYCRRKGVKILGDLPIYVDHDSVDVWTHPSLFKLDEYSMPQFVAGVPPDYFSETGQRWGNPVYDWRTGEESDFAWWMERIRHNLNHFDFIRIDHFRGFVAYWEVPVRELNAINGQWVKAPCDKFFEKICKEFPTLPIIAEDLGTITPDVTEAINRHGFPGMKVLLFAFGGDISTHSYIPENYPERCIAYTGTHDNNTIHGWVKHDATETEKENLLKYFGEKIENKNLHWEFIKRIINSKAATVIFPLQDILGLGEETRMNCPGTKEDNWQWRLSEKSLRKDVMKRMKELTKKSGRC